MGRGLRTDKSMAFPALATVAPWQNITLSQLEDFQPEAAALIVLCAVPGSGKSTLCAALQAKNPHWQRVCLDELRAQVPGSGGEHDQSATPEAIRMMQRKIHQNLAAGITTISDATNVSSKARRWLAQAAQTHARPHYLLVLDYPLSVSKERNQIRGQVNPQREVPEAVLEKMYQQLQATLTNAGAESWNARLRLQWGLV